MYILATAAAQSIVLYTAVCMQLSATLVQRDEQQLLRLIHSLIMETEGVCLGSTIDPPGSMVERRRPITNYRAQQAHITDSSARRIVPTFRVRARSGTTHGQGPIQQEDSGHLERRLIEELKACGRDGSMCGGVAGTSPYVTTTKY